MSRRSALTGVDREAFIKAQIISVHKALNKSEVPLKQKHVRVLIVGTHKEKSSSVFWNTISRIQLEKSPIVSWKFCHLLHKLIRDGHPKVVEETQRYTQRIVQLGGFWQHLHTSGYGLANAAYCKLIIHRLAFLKRNHQFPGSLHLSETQINALVNADVNHTFEVSVEMLDQMDDLMNLQTIVFEAMGIVRWNSLTPQGQCLLAPLILVIVDASKFYDYLVKVIFRLHGQLPADALSGHRERFNNIFRKIKKFFEMASNLQYFKYLVTIPELPEQAPNFLRASDLDTYQTPQAVLHSDDVSESDSPSDGMSIADESLVDISEPVLNIQTEAPVQSQPDEKDVMIETLRRDLEDARLNQARLMNEARSRIEQYENRLLQVKHESDHYKQTLDELKEENDRLHASSILSERHAVDEARLQDSEKRAQNSEQNFLKMKNAYANLRQEHIQALTKLSDAQKDLTNSETERLNNEEVIHNWERKFAELERERSLVEEKARGAACNVDDLQGQLAKCQVDIENLNKTIEDLNASNVAQLEELRDKNKELSMAVVEAQNQKSVFEDRARLAEEASNSMSLRLEDHLAETDVLKKKIKDLKEQSLRDKDEYDKKIGALEMKLVETERKKNIVEEKSRILALDGGKVSGQLAGCLAELESLKQTNSEVKKRLEASVADSCALKQCLNDLESKCEQERGVLRSANQRLQMKVDEQKKELEVLQRKLEEQAATGSKLSSKNTEYLCAIEALKVENTDLSQKLKSLTNDSLGLKKSYEDLNQKGRLVLEKLRMEKRQLETKLLVETQQRQKFEDEKRHLAEHQVQLSGKLTQCLSELECMRQAESTLKKKLEYALEQCLTYKKTLEARDREASQRLQEVQRDHYSQTQALQYKLFEYTCRGIEEFLLHARDDLQSASSISYPIQLALPALRNIIELLKRVATAGRGDVTPELFQIITLFNHGLADSVVNSAAAAYTVSIQHFEPVHEQCRQVAVDALKAIKTFKELNFKDASGTELPKLLHSLEKLEDLCLKLPASSGDISTEQLGAMLEEEMRRMDESMQKAVRMLEEMQKKSRATDSGIRLEVNEKILDSCNALMTAVIHLVAKSKAMQEEIVALGRGTASPNEFYKRNHQWTEGLLSAAKAVGAAANVLVRCADGVVTGKGKFEHLIVASQEIAASTAQLFVSSRVKADRDSKRLADLATASKSVNGCTANVVATVKSGQQTLNDSQNLDFSHLSLHEAKKEEMESQVRTLELEAELMRERARFAELRKQHYHLASLVANDSGSQGLIQ